MYVMPHNLHIDMPNPYPNTRRRDAAGDGMRDEAVTERVQVTWQP